METPEIINRLKEIKTLLEGSYLAECQQVDWYNNNMPNVGITLDYQSYPPKPKALEKIEKLIAELL